VNPVIALAALVLGQSGASPSPEPLIVGIVRDRMGEPVAGARVEGTHGLTYAQDDGTFAVSGGPGDTVSISCSYCETVTVRAGEVPVVAIVRRYQGVAANGPTAHDIARLPIADPQNVLALQPYQVVDESLRVLPGARVYDRGDGYHGAPASFDDVPLYDIAADVSPFLAAPAYAARAIVAAPNLDAPQYGDEALAGYLDVRTSAPARTARLVAGSDGAFSYAAPFAGAQASFAFLTDSLDRRSYVQAGGVHPAGAGVLRWNAIGTRSALSPSFGDYAETEATGVHAQYDDGERPFFASASLVRGSYDAQYGPAPVVSEWSDADVHAGSRSGDATTSRFFDAGLRVSSGMYASRRTIGAALTTADVQGGFSHAGSRFDVQLNAAAYLVRESRIYAESYPPARFILPSLRVTYRPANRWRIDASAVSGFAAASLLERLGIAEDGVPVERDAHRQLDIAYGDDHSLSVSATAIRGTFSGIRRGTIAGDGAAVALQLSPLVSVRAWAYRVMPEIASDVRGFTFDPPMRRATTASAWLTYENEAETRVDVIFRRSLLDWVPYEHLDTFVSGPISPSARWFVKSENRHRTRYVGAGLEIER